MAVSTISTENSNKNEPADFEKAISETGFGKFNLILLCIALPSCIATVYETSTMSYILPSAECDLKLTLLDKGILNAITYAGMISSAIFWGYMADTKGRRKILLFGYLLDAVCVFLGSLSQNVYALMTFKYLGGFLMCGPFAVLMSYLTEFHGVKHRPRVMMVIGTFFSVATSLLPVIAWGILPRSWEFNITNFFVVHSWQIFLAVCSIPSLISGTAVIFMPESPKFLMSQGRNAEALEVFRKIYSVNKHMPKESYPVTTLIMEAPQKNMKRNPSANGDTEKQQTSEHTSMLTSLQAGLRQLKPMFCKPYLSHSLHVYTIQFCILLGLNTMRLWLPQLFSSIAEFETNSLLSTEKGATNLCAMLEYSVNKSLANVNRPIELCEVHVADTMYINTIIVGLSCLCGYFVAGSLINAIGNKTILIVGLSISGTCGLIMFWATNSLMTLITSSLYVAVGSISSTALLGVTLNLFPTTLRTMIVSLAMMFGRLGALIGNVLFPYFMSMGCLPPFLMVGCVMLISSGLCCLLPQTHKSALK